ncbi:MAG: DUF805 domain-containing protein [Alphaproteobacteria bacterium]|nr:DUF805 domain-containing protein [Alphaproteobacteria bacterium]
MPWQVWLFSFKGRLNRARYWAFIGLFVLILVLAFAATAIGPLTAAHGGTAVPVIVLGSVLSLLLLVAVYASFAVAIKRLHDRNRSGWWVLVFAVLPGLLDAIARTMVQANPGQTAAAQGLSVIALPFAIWGFVELACLRGTKGTNRFGPDPLAKDTVQVSPA